VSEEEALAEIESIEQSLDFAAPPMQPYYQAILRDAYEELKKIRQYKKRRNQNQWLK